MLQRIGLIKHKTNIWVYVTEDRSNIWVYVTEDGSNESNHLSICYRG